MDFPAYRLPPPPILTTVHREMLGLAANTLQTALFAAVSVAWITANNGFFFPFTLTDWATAYQLLFWVGATSSGNIDMAIYDSQKNRIVSAGSTAMSATVNTVQELNIADTVLAPGDYLLAAACDNTTGTTFRVSNLSDEFALSGYAVYEQAGLTAAALTDPGVPVIVTAATNSIPVVGIQFRSVF